MKGIFIVMDTLIADIYSRISKRVSKRKNELKKKRSDITKEANFSILSNVINNKINPTKNKYLLNTSIGDDIVSGLDFKNPYELVWGNKKERDEYFFEIYQACINYAENYKNSKKDKAFQKIDNRLLNYFPYALAKANEELGNEYYNNQYNNSMIKSFKLLPDHQKEKQELKRLVKEALMKKQEAIRYYWQIDKDLFEYKHKNFFTDKKDDHYKYTFHLDKRLKDFYKLFLNSLIATPIWAADRGKAIYTLILDNMHLKNDLLSFNFHPSYQDISQDTKIIYEQSVLLFDKYVEEGTKAQQLNKFKL